MIRRDQEELRDCLGVALAEGDNALRIAEAAGFLARFEADDPLVLEAVAWREAHGETVADARDGLDPGALVDGLRTGDARRILENLDSVAAALSFLGWTDAHALEFDLARRAVVALPERFAPYAEDAQALLARAPPLCEDPMRPVWLAVQASQWVLLPAPG